MVKYLLYRKLEIAIRDKKPLMPIHSLFKKFLPSQLSEKSKDGLQDSHFNSLLKHIKESSADVSYLIPSQDYNKTLEFFCIYLTENYSPDLTKNPTLMVCSGPIAKW